MLLNTRTPTVVHPSLRFSFSLSCDLGVCGSVQMAPYASLLTKKQAQKKT